MPQYLDHDPSFSLEALVKRQIELESWVNWGRREVEYPLSTMIPKKVEFSEAALYVFKRSISLITP